ncbi:hypothetical protein NE237_004447 [Protea cynaroides]|uniref:Uncharacterized protein n=1 Tax=Protea cynaroides TaxID=273540 RepID=A0A9Q0KIN5_9MAGN|nr:hypothetical protein NE237_004447 [Protea cynaroides]
MKKEIEEAWTQTRTRRREKHSLAEEKSTHKVESEGCLKNIKNEDWSWRLKKGAASSDLQNPSSGPLDLAREVEVVMVARLGTTTAACEYAFSLVGDDNGSLVASIYELVICGHLPSSVILRTVHGSISERPLAHRRPLPLINTPSHPPRPTQVQTLYSRGSITVNNGRPSLDPIYFSFGLCFIDRGTLTSSKLSADYRLESLS